MSFVFLVSVRARPGVRYLHEGDAGPMPTDRQGIGSNVRNSFYSSKKAAHEILFGELIPGSPAMAEFREKVRIEYDAMSPAERRAWHAVYMAQQHDNRQRVDVAPCAPQRISGLWDSTTDRRYPIDPSKVANIVRPVKNQPEVRKVVSLCCGFPNPAAAPRKRRN